MDERHEGTLSRREMLQQTGIAASSIILAHPAGASVDSGTGAVVLPPGVKAVWDTKLAYSEKTNTRERLCINGLWRWQPAESAAQSVPTGGWGWFKVPGPWPGITDYMQKDCQSVYPHPDWKDRRLASIPSAWYQREITVPASWQSRRITIAAEYINSFAEIFIDGKRIGEMRFPVGEFDLTPHCKPGGKYLLSMHVTAAPLKAVLLSYTDTASAREVKGSVARRGLCGDAWLESTPTDARIAALNIDTSVQRGEVTFQASIAGSKDLTEHRLRVQVRDLRGTPIQEFVSSPIAATDVKDGRYTLTQKWLPDKLWDIHTPANIFVAYASLIPPRGQVVDEFHPVRFGFREFSIKGRDFYLNGSRLYLSVIPLDSAQVGAAWSTYEGAKETFERMKAMGINFVYTHNYDCEPGSHLSFSEILRAADDTGVLIALSQPHFSHYEWQAADADQKNGYARHAEFYCRVAGNHPSVVCYAMSHNATSYVEDMNPDMIDGLKEPRDNWALNNSKKALRAEAIVKAIDPARIVYHHSSGNLSSMHTSNFYVNFAPIQELNDWFEHWATVGVKPLFLCEYGVPFSWDWTMYRGWYQGKREWGSAVVPWEFCLAEWNAQFFGDRAYKIGERERRNLRWEAAQFRAGKVWHRWDYPTTVGSGAFEERSPIFADYIWENWRAYRTWGVSAFSPWEHEMHWLLRDGADKRRKPLPTDWDRLQRPGYSPDYLEERPEDHLYTYDRKDWEPTAAGLAILQSNQPLLAYIGGRADHITSKDHNYLPGETVEKQLVIVNNSRMPVKCECSWHTEPVIPNVEGRQSVTIPTGDQAHIPIKFTIPNTISKGARDLLAEVKYSSGEVQHDAFSFFVLPRTTLAAPRSQIALFDPSGETARLLKDLGVTAHSVTAQDDLARYDLLIVGKGALKPDGTAPNIRRVRDGLKVIVFEQTAETLEQRFGFRTAEYGLRHVFRRIPSHPILAGLEQDNLRDWRGEATTSSPRLKYTVGQRNAPQVKWCGIDVTRVWRCGCRGNVSSVMIEKPAKGDFLPVVDGGYALQYGQLFEYREGKGMVLFCQVDVSGRTRTDPAAAQLARNIVEHALVWKPTQARDCLYIGEAAGKAHLESSGFKPVEYDVSKLGANSVVVVGPDAGARTAGLRDWTANGGHVLAIGLDEAAANAFLSAKVQIKPAEHIAAYFDPPAAGSWLAGVCPADVHNRDVRTLPLVTGGATIVGNGVLAKSENHNVVFNQLVPWQFDSAKPMNQKRTFRRVSYLTTRLLANMGVQSATPLLERFHTPVAAGERRWLDGFYLDTPEEWDDPYRFFGW